MHAGQTPSQIRYRSISKLFFLGHCFKNSKPPRQESAMAYPQHHEHKLEICFPLARINTLISLSSSATSNFKLRRNAMDSEALPLLPESQWCCE